MMKDTSQHDLRGAINAAVLQVELATRAHARQDAARLERSLAAAKEALDRAVALLAHLERGTQ